MKSFIVFALAAVAFCYLVEAGAVRDGDLANEAKIDLDVPAAGNDEVSADDAIIEAARSLDDGDDEFPEIPAPIMESETSFKNFVMKDGKVLVDKAGGEKTVVDKDGKAETTKYGDSP